jgi:hypothetical protein
MHNLQEFRKKEDDNNNNNDVASLNKPQKNSNKNKNGKQTHA